MECVDRMSPPVALPSTPKLSICIATFNRPTFIGATLESMLSQVTNECEIMILDCGPTNETEKVVRQYMHRFAGLRYARQDKNNGLDRDYDRVVELACGEYCWLMTDDDLLKPGAIGAVLRALQGNVSLVVVNVESMDVSMARVLRRRWLDLEFDRRYGPGEMDRLFVDVSNVLTYIGSFVIRRDLWVSRERQPYYGSWFIHLGVTFQACLPGEAVAIAEPFITYRTSNAHTWSARGSEIYLIKWPSMVWSLGLSESTKSKVCSEKPWRDLHRLLLIRGYGYYSLNEYRHWVRPRLQSTYEAILPILVALVPGRLVNALFVLYYAIRRHGGRLQAMRESRFHFRNWWFLYRRS